MENIARVINNPQHNMRNNYPQYYKDLLDRLMSDREFDLKKQ